MARASSLRLGGELPPFHSASSAAKRSASSVAPAGLSVAVILQYSSETKAWISFSRSAISRTATDWTRPGAQASGHLLPEQRADLVADEPVEEPPGLLGVDLVHVDRADVLEGLRTARSVIS